MHNYYKVATEVARDFSDIAFSLRKYLYNRTPQIQRIQGSKSKCFIRYYGRYHGKVTYVCKTALFPISCIRTDIPLGFNQSKCNYTATGTALLHDNLQGAQMDILLYLMKNPVQSASAEYNDNRISLYAGQQGKCFVTGESLQIVQYGNTP